MKYYIFLILALFFLFSCANTSAPVSKNEYKADTTKKPVAPPIPNVTIHFKDLTIGQFEQLNGMLAKTSYKDSATIKPETVMNTQQVDHVLRALSELPYKESVTMIDLLYNSGVRQVKEQTQTK